MKKLLCSICGKNLEGKYKYSDWYCYECYKEWKDDIESRSRWTMWVQNEEKRRRRAPILPVIHLGDKYDVTDDGRLVIREGYHGR